jgi:hypothetical protein
VLYAVTVFPAPMQLMQYKTSTHSPTESFKQSLGHTSRPRAAATTAMSNHWLPQTQPACCCQGNRCIQHNLPYELYCRCTECSQCMQSTHPLVRAASIDTLWPQLTLQNKQLTLNCARTIKPAELAWSSWRSASNTAQCNTAFQQTTTCRQATGACL